MSASAPAISTSRTTPSAFPRSASRTASSRSRSPTRRTSALRRSAAPPPAISPTPSPRRPRAWASRPASSFPPISKPAKILNTQVYGARLVRIDGNYDHVNRLCTLDRRRVQLGLRQREPPALLRRGLEDRRLRDRRAARLAAARQRRRARWPAARSFARSRKPSMNSIALGLVEDEAGEVLRRAGHRLLAHLHRGEERHATRSSRSGRTPSRARSPSATPRTAPAAAKMIRDTGGWAEDVSDVEIVAGIQELAETEGIFTETAGGVTTAVTAQALSRRAASRPTRLTVVCITGNGLKTTDALAGQYRPGARRPPAPGRVRRLPA